MNQINCFCKLILSKLMIKLNLKLYMFEYSICNTAFPRRSTVVHVVFIYDIILFIYVIFLYTSVVSCQFFSIPNWCEHSCMCYILYIYAWWNCHRHCWQQCGWDSPRSLAHLKTTVESLKADAIFFLRKLDCKPPTKF